MLIEEVAQRMLHEDESLNNRVNIQVMHDFFATAVDVLYHRPVYHFGLAVEDGEEMILDEVEEIHIDFARIQLLLELTVSLPVFSIKYFEADCNLVGKTSIGLDNKH